MKSMKKKAILGTQLGKVFVVLALFCSLGVLTQSQTPVRGSLAGLSARIMDMSSDSALPLTTWTNGSGTSCSPIKAITWSRRPCRVGTK